MSANLAPYIGGPAKRPPQRADSAQVQTGRKPHILAEEIGRMVSELWASNDPREFSRVIARRLGISEARVDRIVAGLLLEHEREAHTLQEAARNGLRMAVEAGEEVWEEGAA